VGWLIATTQKTVAFHAVRCVNPLVALIGKITNSVRGWILTGFAKARLVCAMGANAGARTISSAVSGIGGRTMDDLISRAATLERMKSMAGCATCDNYNYVRCRACIWDDAMNIVEEMSEIEAVPMVRCQDCMYWKSDMLTHFWKPCDVVKTAEDWYCPCGKRR